MSINLREHPFESLRICLVSSSTFCCRKCGFGYCCDFVEVSWWSSSKVFTEDKGGRNHHAECSLVGPTTGETPLMVAVEKGCIKTIKILLENGANKEEVDALGYKARDYTKDEAIQQLLDEFVPENPD